MAILNSFNSATDPTDAIETFNDVLASITALKSKVAAIPPVVSFGLATLSQNEGNSGTTAAFVYPVTLDKAWPSDIVYEYVTAPTGSSPADAADFVGGAFPRGTITFPAGITSINVSIPVAGDTVVEPNENFIVRLYRVAASSLGTILNDDTAPALNNLTVSPATAKVGAAYSGTIAGLTSGSAISLTGAGAAGLSISGAVITGTPTTAGPVNIVETLAGATYSPRTTSGSITVAAGAVLPQTAAIVGHWRTEDITPVADGATVSTWTDRANGYNLTATTPPAYRTNRQGAFPTLQFTGTQFMTAGRTACPAIASAMADTSTIMIVMRTAPGTGGTTILAGWGTTGSNTNFLVANGQRAGAFQADLPFTDTGFFTLSRNAGNNSGGSTLTAAGVAINGGLVNANGGNTDSSNNIGLMCRATSATAGDLMAKGEVLAFVIWNRRLTPAEHIQADNYFRSVYGATNPRAGLSRFTVFDGDSITASLGAAASEFSAPYVAAASLGLAYGQWSVTAIPGINWDTLSTKAPLDIDAITASTAANMPLRLWVMEWYNQAGQASRATGAGANVASKTQSYVTARMSANAQNHVILATPTSSAADESNSNVERADYTARLVANAASWGVAALARVDQDANIGANGSCTNTTYFQSDQIHLTGSSATPDGYEKLAAAMVTGMTGQ